MKLSVASARANFKNLIGDKRGSAYVEAAMVLPVSCLILVAMAGLIMAFHGSVGKQTASHIEEIRSWDCEAEIEVIRNYERFIDWI